MAVGGFSTWDDATNSLYFNDLFARDVGRYSLDDNKVYKVPVGNGETTSYITPISGRPNHYLVGLNNRAVVFEWNGTSSEATEKETFFTGPAGTIFSTILATANNDIIMGVFADTFCENPANLSLYRTTRTGEQVVAATGFVVTAGLALDEERNTLYQLDPCTWRIYGYDYDPDTGDLCKSLADCEQQY